MPRYALNLPMQLKQEAEHWATLQGVSLDEFILWALAEKVGSLSQQLDDPAFPHVTYRRSAGGPPVPVVRGTGIRVQTLAVAAWQWGLTLEQIVAEYGLSEAQVADVLAFAAAHAAEIDLALVAEEALATESSRA